MNRFVLFSVLVACLMAPAWAADITRPGDEIIGLPPQGHPTVHAQSLAWPEGEAPQFAIDDTLQKYLHFKPTDGTLMGFAVRPTHNDKVVVGMTFTSANDTPDRDPLRYELSGSNDSINGPWTHIHTGETGFRGDWPRNTKISTPRIFPNTQVYQYYRVLFPELRNLTAANSMQIAEVELLDGTPDVSAGGPYIVRLPNALQLNPVVVDLDTPLEELTYQWSFVSGPEGVDPQDVDFGDTAGDRNAVVSFPNVRGIYQLFLQVSDGLNDANDLAIVRVWDPDVDDVLLAHWAMNDGPESLVVTDHSGNNHHGVIGSHLMGTDPNWALNFYQYGYVEVIPDVNAPSPNLNDVQYMISIAAWFNSRGWTGNHRILQKGLSDNQFRLLVEGSQLRFHLAGVGEVRGPLPTLNLWHHVAAIYDGAAIRLYLDGVQVASTPARGLISTSGDPLYIGTKSKFVDPSAHPGDYFTGMIDDVWIFNYALGEDDILDLIRMGQNAPPVILGIEGPSDLVLSVSNSIDLDATVFDVNGDLVNYHWTAVGPDDVTFWPADNVEDVTVSFVTGGTYTIRLTIDDGMFGLDGEIYTDFVVTVRNPTCADVIAEGITIPGDLNSDCRVDLADLAAIAANWLACNDPLDPNCENPFAR